MKNTKRKGFTIVELVIVIAVIAILAAVLIPTFASLVKKANVSADEQAVKQMNTALAIYTAENGKPETVAQVKTALDKNLINAESLVPVTQGYAFYWNPTDNEIVLVGKDGKITKPGDAWLLLSTTGYGKSTETSNASDISNAINVSNNANPALIKLTGDVTVPSEGAIKVESGKSVVVDLQGHTMTREGASVFLVLGGTLTVKDSGGNGSLVAGQCCVYNNGGDVTLQNVTMKNVGKILQAGKEESSTSASDYNWYAPVQIKGISNTAIVGCTLESEHYMAISTNSSDSEADGARLTVKNSTLEGEKAGMFISIYADVTIEDSAVFGKEHGAFFRGNNAKISNSKIYHTNEKSVANTNAWVGNGNQGPEADIVFACGTASSGYFTTANYTCENVTGKDGAAINVIVHQPKGGTVNVSGIENYHKCTKAFGAICTGDNTTCSN